ncbi:MAG: hypothetical protein OHK0026_15400 [Rhodocyclaceae bacterium]
MADSAFDARERRAVEAAMIYRYGAPVALAEADVELRLQPGSEALTTCPGLYWNERGVQFVVCRTGPKRYRSYFFYTEAEQFRIGEHDYDSIEECVRSLLQLQTDHERMRKGIFSGATAKDLGGDEDEYFPPPILL